MRVRENLDVIVERHPHYKSINDKLLKEIETIDYSFSYETNVKAKMTSFKFFPEEGQAIRDWVTTLIFKYYSYLITGYGKIVHVNSWVARYDDGDSTKDHNHHPIDFNYIYYVNCPKGSSPLILTSSGKKIKAEEGKVVIFPGITQHYVPKNRCDNRIVLAGNVEMMA